MALIKLLEDIFGELKNDEKKFDGKHSIENLYNFLVYNNEIRKEDFTKIINDLILNRRLEKDINQDSIQTIYKQLIIYKNNRERRALFIEILEETYGRFDGGNFGNYTNRTIAEDVGIKPAQFSRLLAHPIIIERERSYRNNIIKVVRRLHEKQTKNYSTLLVIPFIKILEEVYGEYDGNRFGEYEHATIEKDLGMNSEQFSELLKNVETKENPQSHKINIKNIIEKLYEKQTNIIEERHKKRIQTYLTWLCVILLGILVLGCSINCYINRPTPLELTYFCPEKDSIIIDNINKWVKDVEQYCNITIKPKRINKDPNQNFEKDLHISPMYYKSQSKVLELYYSHPYGMKSETYKEWFWNEGREKHKDYANLKENNLPYSFLPFGNTNEQAGGWYTKEIKKILDFKGMKIRMYGDGFRVLKSIESSIERIDDFPNPNAIVDLIDSLGKDTLVAWEYINMHTDSAMGFLNIVTKVKNPIYFYPKGFHEPGTVWGLHIKKDSKYFRRTTKEQRGIFELLVRKYYDEIAHEYKRKGEQALEKIRALKQENPDTLTNLIIVEDANNFFLRDSVFIDTVRKTTKILFEDIPPNGKPIYNSYMKYLKRQK